MTTQTALNASGVMSTSPNQSGATTLTTTPLSGFTAGDTTVGGAGTSGVNSDNSLDTVQMPSSLQSPTINYPASSAGVGNLISSPGGALSTGGSIYNILQGYESGNALGEASATLGTLGLANKAGASGVLGLSSGETGLALGGASGVLGLVSGLERGGVAGYGQATVGGLQAAAAGEDLAGNTALGGTLSGVAGDLAAPLSVYNAIANWQQGNTLGNTINSAEAGAAIGSIALPGIGTLIGAGIGAIVGGVTSLIQGQHTMENITNPNEPNSTTIKLQSGNSALLSNASTPTGTAPSSGVAFGAGSSRGQGGAQWFLVPAQTGFQGAGNNAQGQDTDIGVFSTEKQANGGYQMTQGVPYYIGTQASEELTNFANSVPTTNGQPDLSSYEAAYKQDPNSTDGLIGVYNNNGGQAAWGMSYNQWLQSIWTAKNGVTGNLST